MKHLNTCKEIITVYSVTGN